MHGHSPFCIKYHFISSNNIFVEGHGGHSLLNLDKSSVLQEARATFNGTPVVARKCSHVLTKILMVLNQGEAIGMN